MHLRGVVRCAAVLGRRAVLALAAVCGVIAMLRSAGARAEERWSQTGCTRSACHQRIEAIRAPESEMMRQLRDWGAKLGEPDGCTPCHGGTPEAAGADAAHRGANPALTAEGGPDGFYPDPASPWVNARSCGNCHAAHVRAQWSSLMMTEAGKIQGTAWGFGAREGYGHGWANYDLRNPENAHAQLGTDAYRAYMAQKKALHPNVYPEVQKALPPAPGGLGDTQPLTTARLKADPGLAAFTYIRSECQRCHLGVRGRSRRGDYRGMGCGACHIPYSNEGRYEGADACISKSEAGHLLLHRIQATRDAPLSLHGVDYSGIPVETCTTCHNRGKRIGVSYQGLMESAWGSPYTEGGGGQPGLHSKHYIAMEQDVHFQKGMLCQDCHTSGDVHGDGMIAGTNLAAVEIECSDCHGTPQAYPWELPLGYGDESVPGPATGEPRGLAMELAEHLKQGAVEDALEGYLLSARGNPMPDVVRDGKEVLVRTASGRDLRLIPLKAMRDGGTLGLEAEVAMVHADSHIERMECYSCHTQWAPQCYGCHIEIDYSGAKRSFDWVAAGQRHQAAAFKADKSEADYAAWLPGSVREMRSYLRWEDPPLGVNGEGRVTPLIPGCQTTVTIIGPDGTEVARNKIFRGVPHAEGAGEAGQLAIDMSPVHPHTVGPARPCESCHASDKALGYGIGGQRGVNNRGPTRPWSTDKVVDLMRADGVVLPKGARTQIAAIGQLDHDWSAILDVEGRQLQTVGHHWQGSGPLTQAQRDKLDRRGVCVSCHQHIPAGTLSVSLLHHVAEYAGALPLDRAAHAALVGNSLEVAAFAETSLPIGLCLIFAALILRWWRARKPDSS